MSNACECPVCHGIYDASAGQCPCWTIALPDKPTIQEAVEILKRAGANTVALDLGATVLKERVSTDDIQAALAAVDGRRVFAQGESYFRVVWYAHGYEVVKLRTTEWDDNCFSTHEEAQAEIDRRKQHE